MATESKFNWSNFGVALGVFAGTAALGLLTVTLAKGKKKPMNRWDAIPVFTPATGAGVAAYFLRKRCPSCIEQTITGGRQLEPVGRKQDVLI